MVCDWVFLAYILARFYFSRDSKGVEVLSGFKFQKVGMSFYC